MQDQKSLLLTKLVAEGVLRSSKVKQAMSRVPREGFLPDRVRSHAYIDCPLPIGYGQTISAPHMVAMMAEALEVEAGQIVLEIGSGSGYHAAVLAELVTPITLTPRGHIYSVEIIPELAAFARKNLKQAGYEDRVTIILGDGSLGHPEQAPYDRISVTAAAPQIPEALVMQLKKEGMLVIPVGNTLFYQKLLKVRKQEETKTSLSIISDVAFVPLRGRNGWKK
ncbi:MAG: protein-L-isoaspartate(D-aspartate) O-methyltransferase [Candidatus Bathyarchaeota archaeon]|nr:MAG: protein-L-isoaspartate(D-aspartate) O-methyltransferase [Candidatus Bathyarchaeota archaeon]